MVVMLLLALAPMLILYLGVALLSPSAGDYLGSHLDDLWHIVLADGCMVDRSVGNGFDVHCMIGGEVTKESGDIAMSVTMYSRLGELLRTKSWTVAELERHIDEHFGVLVDPDVLDRLMRDGPIRHADLSAIGAVATVLGIELGDLFRVRAIPIDADAEEDMSDLSRKDSRCLDMLVARQDRGPLLESEQADMRELITKSARHMHERRVRQYARQRRISEEQARREMEDSFDEAIDWLRAFESDPQQQRDVEKRIEQMHE